MIVTALSGSLLLSTAFIHHRLISISLPPPFIDSYSLRKCGRVANIIFVWLCLVPTVVHGLPLQPPSGPDP